MWYMDGVEYTGGIPLQMVGDLDWKIVGVADFNGDGRQTHCGATAQLDIIMSGT